MTKACIRCGCVKPVAMFHVHKMMKDGRLNKCAACVVECVQAWREANPSGRKREWVKKQHDRGFLAAFKMGLGKNQNPESRRAAGLKYQHKRRIQKLERPTFDSELDDLAFYEAKALCVSRQALTGVKWEIDHIVPLNHRVASGLHSACNFQVAPKAWNVAKGNRHMDRFFG